MLTLLITSQSPSSWYLLYIIMDNENELKLAFKIKFERKKKNITQEKLAEMTGLSVVTIRKLERGVGNITVKNLCKIARVLELDLGILTDFKF